MIAFCLSFEKRVSCRITGPLRLIPQKNEYSPFLFPVKDTCKITKKNSIIPHRYEKKSQLIENQRPFFEGVVHPRAGVRGGGGVFMLRLFVQLPCAEGAEPLPGLPAKRHRLYCSPGCAVRHCFFSHTRHGGFDRLNHQCGRRHLSHRERACACAHCAPARHPARGRGAAARHCGHRAHSNRRAALSETRTAVAGSAAFAGFYSHSRAVGAKENKGVKGC